LSAGSCALHPENEETTSEPKAPENMMLDGALNAQIEKWMSTKKFSQIRDDPNVESCGSKRNMGNKHEAHRKREKDYSS
jgi:hypothetical protein